MELAQVYWARARLGSGSGFPLCDLKPVGLMIVQFKANFNVMEPSLRESDIFGHSRSLRALEPIKPGLVGLWAYLLRAQH